MKKKFENLQTFNHEEIRNMYIQEFFNLYMSNFESEGVGYQERNYILRKLWRNGVVAQSRAVGYNEIPIFTTFASSAEFNLYDFPTAVYLINVRNSPLVSNDLLYVDKDVILIYAMRNHMPIAYFIEQKVEKIVACESLLWQNQNALKMPFFVVSSAESKESLANTLRKILAGDPAVFGGLEVADAIRVLQTNAPYLIDKLQIYREQLINEVLTFLGIDNNGAMQKKERSIIDEINSNNENINIHGDCLIDEMQEGFDRANALFGTNIHFKIKEPKVNSIHEEVSEDESEGDEE